MPSLKNLHSQTPLLWLCFWLIAYNLITVDHTSTYHPGLFMKINPVLRSKSTVIILLCLNLFLLLRNDFENIFQWVYLFSEDFGKEITLNKMWLLGCLLPATTYLEHLELLSRNRKFCFRISCTLGYWVLMFSKFFCQKI